MPIIGDSERHGWHGRLATFLIYLVLGVGGLAMAYPFLVTITGSVSNAYDYDRRAPWPHFLSSRPERLMRVLCAYYPPEQRLAIRQLRSDFPDWPEAWLTWRHAGDDPAAAAWARRQLDRLDDPARTPALHQLARDYREFADRCDLAESTLAPATRDLAPFLRRRYGDIAALNAAWEMAVDDFSDLTPPPEWVNEPYSQQSYVPRRDTRYADLLAFRQSYRGGGSQSFLADDPAAMLLVRPAGLAFTWEEFAAGALGTADRERLRQLPFPVPADAPTELRRIWLSYLEGYFPLRHVQIAVTPARQAAYTAFLQERFRSLGNLNQIMLATASGWQPVASWEELALAATLPTVQPLDKAWMSFVKSAVPAAEWRLRETLPEQAFQAFAQARHGSLAALNQAYGLELTSLQQLRLPAREALLVTFAAHEQAFTWDQLSQNYRLVLDYLVLRGRAVGNTAILVMLSLLVALTVNPLAGYALSRFRLRQTERILIFCLATMAFPAAVSAIPGFLLLRDLSLLNTFAALVLPGAASGMGIFLLKGFFDSLPQELFEAATIDGAPEWQIFLRISLPLVKPILAVNLLHAFIGAYSGWEWAIIVCQKQSMWTIAVWTYQFSQQFASQPYAVMAAYVLSSLPVFVVFLLCQRIIMRGIILPQMK